MEFMNFFPIKSRSPFFRYFCYIDTRAYLADQLFIKHKVKVNYGDEYHKKETDYLFIFCRIKKRDETEFLAALAEMKNKAILLGYSDYGNFCNDMQKQMFELYNDQ